MTNHSLKYRPDTVDHISTNQMLAMALGNMHLECIIPIFAERSENLQDPRLGRIFERQSKLQEHCFKPVCFSHCPQGIMDNDLQPETQCNQEWPLALVNIMECSEADDNLNAEHCLPALHPQSNIPFLSPTFSSEPSPSECERHSPSINVENCSGSKLQCSSNHGGQVNPFGTEKESLENGRADPPSYEVAEFREVSPIRGTHLHKCQNNRPANSTVLDIGHIHGTQYSSNSVMSWQSRLDITFSSETGRSYPSERNMWPGRIIPLNPVTEERLQDPRIAPPVFRSTCVGQFTLRPDDFQSSQHKYVAFGSDRMTRISSADNRVADLVDTSGRQSDGTSGATPAGNHVKDVFNVKCESQEIGTVMKDNKNECVPSQAQIEQWLAANRKLWDRSFIQSPEAPSEQLQSVYSPSSVLSPLFSPDVLLSPSSVSSPIRRQPTMQVTHSESDKQTPAKQESKQVLSKQKSQADPPEQSNEPAPAGPEPSQALHQRCDSGSFAYWPPVAYWFPLQPLWPQMSSAQKSCVTATHPPMRSEAPSSGPRFAAEAPTMAQSAKPVVQSLSLLAPNMPPHPSVFMPATRQVEVVPQYPRCYPAPPPFVPPSQEQVPLVTSVPHQLPEEREFSFLPTEPQVHSAYSQSPAYYEPASIAPPALQALAVPQTLGTESTHSQMQPEVDMPMRTLVQQPFEYSYEHAQMLPKAGSEFKPQAFPQERPLECQQTQTQSDSQLEPSLTPQGSHSSECRQSEAQTEGELDAEALQWQEISYVQKDGTLEVLYVQNETQAGALEESPEDLQDMLEDSQMQSEADMPVGTLAQQPVEAGALEDSAGDSQDKLEDSQMQSEADMPMGSLAQQPVEHSCRDVQVLPEAGSEFKPRAPLLELPLEYQQMQAQSDSLREPSVPPQGSHSSECPQSEAQMEGEVVAEALEWQEISYVQKDGTLEVLYVPNGTQAGALEDSAGDSQDILEDSEMQSEANMPMGTLAQQPVEKSYQDVQTSPEAGSEFKPRAPLLELPLEYQHMQVQSDSLLEPSLPPQGSHSSECPQREAQMEGELMAEALQWQELSYEQQGGILEVPYVQYGTQAGALEDWPQEEPYGYSVTEWQEEYSYEQPYWQPNTESWLEELAPPQYSEMQLPAESHPAALVRQLEIFSEHPERPPQIESGFDQQVPPQLCSFCHLQTQPGEFQVAPLQETLQHTCTHMHPQAAALSATPVPWTDGPLFTYPNMHQSPKSAAAPTTPSLGAHPFMHMHPQLDSTHGCVTSLGEPRFLQPAMQMQGEVVQSSVQLSCAVPTQPFLQQPVSTSAAPFLQLCSGMQQVQCGPTQLMYPVPTVELPKQHMPSTPLTPLCTGLVAAPQSSAPWPLPAMHCLNQQCASHETSPAVALLPGTTRPSTRAVPSSTTFQLPLPASHPSLEVVPMPPLPTSPPPSKPPPPSMPPPPVSPPPERPPPPSPTPPPPPAPSPPLNSQRCRKPPPPFSPPPPTPLRLSESPRSSSLRQSKRCEKSYSKSSSPSRSPHSRYPIWAPSYKRSYCTENKGRRHSTKSFKTSRTTW
nr:titin-like [Dermacentor andersoni]